MYLNLSNPIKCYNLETIRIAIADDHALFRRGMVSLLKSIPDFEVVFEASNGQELVDNIPLIMPDLVIMDLKMPLMDGMKATELIRNTWLKKIFSAI